jgi:hypothetical protein
VGDTSSAALELGLELREQDDVPLVVEIAFSSRETRVWSGCFCDECGGNELKRASG